MKRQSAIGNREAAIGKREAAIGNLYSISVCSYVQEAEN